MQRIACFVVAVSFLIAAASARGVDGVLEINQTCAVNTGCFAGDTPGFPVTVGANGTSVRLTGDLTVPNTYSNAIHVTGNDVTVDLNGFALLGPNVCTGTPATCDVYGSAPGVGALGSGTTVSNGSVHGFGGAGVSLQTEARVVGVRATSNGSIGIVVSKYSLITGCVASQNAAGIYGAWSVIRDNVSSSNTGHGIDAYISTVIGNTLVDNGSFGLDGTGGTAYGHNQMSGNNGGDANPQVSPGLSHEIAPNVCGGDLVCP